MEKNGTDLQKNTGTIVKEIGLKMKNFCRFSSEFDR